MSQKCSRRRKSYVERTSSLDHHRMVKHTFDMSRLLPFLLFTSVAMISCVVPGGLGVGVYVASNTVNLHARQYLNISDVHLVLQPDCDLILYNSTNLPYESTNTSIPGPSSARNCSLILQGDANLVLYNLVNNNTELVGQNAIWSSSTQTKSNASIHNFLILKSDGSYTLYDYVDHLSTQVVEYRSLQPYFTPSNTSGTLETIGYPFPPESAWKPESSLVDFPYMPAEYFLSQGFKLQTANGSINGQFVLALGTDCNLQSKALFSNGSVKSVLWETGTNSSENRECQLTLQRDGRLELRGKNSSILYWNSTNIVGNENVSWFLTLNYENGQLAIVDILDRSKTPYWTNSVATSSSPAASPNSSNKSSSITWIIVGVLGGGFVVVLTALGLYFALEPSFLDPAEKGFRQRLQKTGGLSQVFSSTKIKKATNNFSKVIGVGGFGDVFFGKLPDGQEIAAKVLSTDSHQTKVEFYNEIELLSKVHHKHLVSLLGYSCTRKYQVLIYEYMGGGDLRQRLQGENVAMNPLTWRQRTTIAHQIAEGLEYLHDKCSPSIIHRDVKSTNILLTNKMDAKVADFGLSKLKAIGQEDATHITTIVKGTPGYLDPEYHETGLLTDKSDVYAFGIVLMEILTGLKPMGIANQVREAWMSELLYDLVDPTLGDEYNKDEFASLVELALRCVKINSFERPFMRQVIQTFRKSGLMAIEHPLYESDVSLGEEVHHANAFEISSMGYDVASSMESSSSSGTKSDAQLLSKGLQSRQSTMI